MAELAERCPGLSEDVIQHIEGGRSDGEGRRRRAITVDELLVITAALGAEEVSLPVHGTTSLHFNFTTKGTAEQQQAIIDQAEATLKRERDDYVMMEAKLRDMEQNWLRGREELERVRAQVESHADLVKQLRAGQIKTL